MASDSMSFKEAYGVLQGHAETLRQQAEPNIDDLLRIVEESVGAYKVCKQRIDAVEQALQKALVDLATDAPSRSSSVEEGRVPAAGKGEQAKVGARPAAADSTPSGQLHEMDDDIPF